MAGSRTPSATGAEARVMRRVKAIREARGWSQARLAEAVTAAGGATTRASITRLERGVRRLMLDECVEYAAALGVEVADLISDEPLGFDVAVRVVRP